MSNKTVEAIFQAKERRRRELAKLTIEEKIKILVELQKIACPILSTRGIKRTPWVI